MFKVSAIGAALFFAVACVGLTAAHSTATGTGAATTQAMSTPSDMHWSPIGTGTGSGL